MHPVPAAASLRPETLSAVIELARSPQIERVSVQELAEVAGYSTSRFTRLFTSAMRVPPGQYLTALRIERAKRLLLAEQEPVIDIAAAVGFDSLSSFTRRFRAATGVPPAVFRRLEQAVADAPLGSFTRTRQDMPEVTLLPRLPEGESDALSLWLGWYRHPAPIGLPLAGMFVPFDEEIRLPMCPGAPWLLCFATAPGDVRQQLLPTRPLVALPSFPVTAPGRVPLPFFRAGERNLPILSALPSLSP